MLRFMYTVLDWLAGICAVASPVAIAHWLIGITKPGPLGEYFKILDPVFNPLNAILDVAFKSPSLMYQGAPVPLTEGILAIILTVLFFIFHAVAEALKTAEQKLDVGKQALIQRHRLKQLENSSRKQEKQITTNRRIQVCVHYDFQACPLGGKTFDAAYPQFGGKLVGPLDQSLVLEFDSLNQALKYTLESSQALLSYYATLRPMDPQPPFQIAIHAPESSLLTPDALAATQQLIKYAGANFVVFSQEVKAIMEAQSLGIAYRYQSLGIYALPGGSQQEVFRLFSSRQNA